MANNVRGIRVRLEFLQNEIEKCWYFVDFSKFETVKRLRRDIRNRFCLGSTKINMYIDDYLLTSEQPIHILRDNDLIIIKSELKETNTVELIPRESTEQPFEKKKRRRRKKIKRMDEESNIEEVAVLVHSPKVLRCATSKHKHFDYEGNEEKDDEPKMNISFDSFDNCPALIGVPRIGDLIAYKELVLSSDYTPQVSSYRVGRVLSYSDGNITVQLMNEHRTPRLNGKFEIFIDDDNAPIDRAVVSVATLIEPKLVNDIF